MKTYFLSVTVLLAIAFAGKIRIHTLQPCEGWLMHPYLKNIIIHQRGFMLMVKIALE